MRRKTLRASVVALALLFPVAAAAHETAPAASAGAVVVDESCTTTTATREQDQAAVEAALSAINQRGYRGLASHLDALREVAEHTPSCFPATIRRGSNIVLRTEEPSGSLTLALLLSTVAQQEGQGSVAVSYELNTYPLALLLLGANDVEHQRYEDGLRWLDRGLVLQPNHQYLTFEKVAALQGLRRFQEAADLLQAMINNPELTLALTLDRSRAHRNLGVVLIDLDRLDEAEAALNESIRLEPNNPGARSELEYLAELRRGAAQRELGLRSPASQPQTQND